MQFSFLHYRLETAQHLVMRKKKKNKIFLMNRNRQKFNETELQVNSLSEQLLSITYILHKEVSSMTNSTNSTQNHVEDLNSLFFIFRFHFLKCCIPSAVSCL